MQATDFVPDDAEWGSFDDEHRVPLVRLRERRRDLVLSLKDSITRERIRTIAEVHLAIAAIEAVITE